jgi:hypothetical protein
VDSDVTIVFDDAKRAGNLAKHGYDFADLALPWFEAATVLPGKGRNRLMAIGPLGGVTIAVIFQSLGVQGLSVISMRHASARERKLHNDRRQST